MFPPLSHLLGRQTAIKTGVQKIFQQKENKDFFKFGSPTRPKTPEGLRKLEADQYGQTWYQVTHANYIGVEFDGFHQITGRSDGRLDFYGRRDAGESSTAGRPQVEDESSEGEDEELEESSEEDDDHIPGPSAESLQEILANIYRMQHETNSNISSYLTKSGSGSNLQADQLPTRGRKKKLTENPKDKEAEMIAVQNKRKDLNKPPYSQSELMKHYLPENTDERAIGKSNARPPGRADKTSIPLPKHGDRHRGSKRITPIEDFLNQYPELK